MKPTTDQTTAQRDAAVRAKIWLFGHPFRPMDESDFDAFAGASEGSLIAFPSDDVVLIYDPASEEIAEIWDGGQRLWQLHATLT